MLNAEFNPPSFYAIRCAHGRSHFNDGHRANSEVLKFRSMADREEYIYRVNAAHSACIDPVAWGCTAQEAAQYVRLDCYALNHREEVYRAATGLALFHYNAKKI